MPIDLATLVCAGENIIPADMIAALPTRTDKKGPGLCLRMFVYTLFAFCTQANILDDVG